MHRTPAANASGVSTVTAPVTGSIRRFCPVLLTTRRRSALSKATPNWEPERRG